MDIAKFGKIGFGTFGSDKYDEATVASAVYTAIQCGYRIFDCASVYGNEKQIGEVFARAFEKGIVKREDLFIISKVWNDKHGEGEVIASCKQSLKDLGLDYIDLYFTHWPFPNYHAKGCDVSSRNKDSRPFFVQDFMSAWKQMEWLKENGLAKNIGMSNMTIPKFEAVLPLCNVLPYAHEMELHPSFQQEELYSYCKSKGMNIIGYCPIGSPNRPERDKTAKDIVDTQLYEVNELSKKYDCHPVEICLRWASSRGHIPIPFSSSENNIKSNILAVEKPLISQDMELIKSAEKNCRLVKGHVFLWDGAKDWADLWDDSGKLENWK
ncbi:MAG: aldo/keto reductase, partial [Bacteroidales bacterium]